MTDTWEGAILKILRAHNKAMSLKDIYHEMEHQPLVTAHHTNLWKGQPNFHHWIRSALARLKQRGNVRQVGRALYISN